MKIYGIWNGSTKLDAVPADNVHEAFRQGRLLYGTRCTAAIWEGTTAAAGHRENGIPRPEPMFL